METTLLAISLKVQSCGERDQLVTLWTDSVGKLALYANRAHRPLWLPLNQLEVVAVESHSGLWRASEVRLLNSFPEIRQNLNAMVAAGHMARALLSQPRERAAPLLYSLFVDYMRRLEAYVAPEAIATSFYLKILRHEGAWSAIRPCNVCETISFPLYVSSHEVWCSLHAPHASLAIGEESWNRLAQLATCTSGSQLAAIPCDGALLSTASALFEQFSLAT